MKRYFNGSAIARLIPSSRMTANERLRAGDFGEVVRQGRIKYVAQEQIEARAGHSFTEAQIAAAIEGVPSRRLILQIDTSELINGLS